VVASSGEQGSRAPIAAGSSRQHAAAGLAPQRASSFLSWCTSLRRFQGADGSGGLKSVQGCRQSWRCPQATRRSEQGPEHARGEPSHNSGRGLALESPGFRAGQQQAKYSSAIGAAEAAPRATHAALQPFADAWPPAIAGKVAKKSSPSATSRRGRGLEGQRVEAARRSGRHSGRNPSGPRRSIAGSIVLEALLAQQRGACRECSIARRALSDSPRTDRSWPSWAAEGGGSIHAGRD